QRVVLVALDLRPEPARPGDDEAEVADLRDVDPRVVDLVDDAEAEGEPQPRRTQRGADHILGTARPARRSPRGAGRVFELGFRRCDRHCAIVARLTRLCRVSRRSSGTPRPGAGSAETKRAAGPAALRHAKIVST